MNKKQYEAKRRELLAEAEKLLADGKAEEAEAKMKEVTDLDEAWEKIAQAQANFAALNREPSAVNVFGANGSLMNFGEIQEKKENVYDTKEYRTAFMNFVVKGTKIPDKFTNEAGPTKTTDIGTVISPVVVNRIIEKMEAIGMILPLVTQTSYAPGASIPTSNRHQRV